MQGEVVELRGQLEAVQQATVQDMKDRGMVADLRLQLEAMRAQLDAVLSRQSRAGRGDARRSNDNVDRPLDSTAP